MSVWYNEHDHDKAEVLRELMRAGVIAAGDVDERSIKDVRASDLMGYTQCHFFAGIGVWSYAARRAGWPDHRPMWSGSCPCPSFSAAGKGGGFDDPRHLWPVWYELIRECRPPVVFGEQADDAIGYGWLDLVQTDLEAKAYAVGKVVFGAHSVGAPHIRQRLYFVADAAERGWDRRRAGETRSEPRSIEQPKRSRDAGELADDDFHGCFPLRRSGADGDQCHAESRRAVGGFWADAEWIPCRDPKVPGGIEWRAIEPGTFPLADGASARVLALRCFGDAIAAPQAEVFIRANLEAHA
ncbi:MAG: DNA cytosine methyltransferase [Acidobacteriota bacterium]|nr:DNA cytosine methyltransferase [Acidobacteriota bacterium]